MMSKPTPNEYVPYQEKYVNQVSGDVLTTLTALKDSTYNFLTSLPHDKADYAYAEGKWTIKTVINHLTDAERVFAYRLMAYLRGEKQSLPGFDENEYAEAADVRNRTIADLAAEFKATRESTIYLVKTITPQQELIQGIASGNVISVRALAYIIAGHELHHLQIINERYL